MIVSAPNSFLQLSISDHICFAFSISNFLALKNLYHETTCDLPKQLDQVKEVFFMKAEHAILNINDRKMKSNLSIIWWSSCLEGSSSSKISAWRNASTACNSSALRLSSIAIDITLLCLRPLFVKEFLNLFEALIAFFFNDPSLVFLSSSEYSASDFSRPV